MKELILIIITKSINNISILRKIFYRTSLRYIDVYRNYSYDFYKNGEWLLIKRLRSFVKDQDIIFFDVGCNQGEWSKEFLNEFTNATGHLFDLNSNLKSTIERNLKGFKINLTFKALSNSHDKISYLDFGGKGNVNTTITNSNFHNKKVTLKKIESITGDDYIKKNKIDHIFFLKIDTEGADLKVLEGFKNSLSQKKIKLIQFEYGYTNGDSKSLMKDFYQLLESYGYKISRLDRKVRFRSFKYTDNDFKSGPNYIATCDENLIKSLELF